MSTQDPALADISFEPPVPPNDRMTEEEYVAWAYRTRV